VVNADIGAAADLTEVDAGLQNALHRRRVPDHRAAAAADPVLAQVVADLGELGALHAHRERVTDVIGRLSIHAQTAI
jgi:hypothetical protein